MYTQPHPSHIHSDAMSRTERYAPEARVPDPLDRDAGDDAEDGEEDEGTEIAKDEEAEQERQRRERHVCHRDGVDARRVRDWGARVIVAAMRAGGGVRGRQ